TSSPASHEPSPLSSRPNSLSSISANQLWLELRMGKRMSGSGRPRKSASGEAQQRSVRYASESVVLAAPPCTATPLRASAAARARAAYRFGSGRATLSTRAFRPNATVPSARMLHPSIPPAPPPPPPPVPPIPPPPPKNLPPTAELASERP